MDLELKAMLHKKIETVAPLYGLTDICYPSFARTYGWKYRFSASDVVYSLATLLETSPSAATRLGENVNWNQDEDWDALDNESGDTGDGIASVRHKWWMRNFYTTYDAINRYNHNRTAQSWWRYPNDAKIAWMMYSEVWHYA